MYILKNAVVSIWRNKSRNLLIGIIILVIACAASVTLAINNSSNSLIESYESKYEVQATLGVNRENMMGSFDPSDKDSSKENMMEMFSSANEIDVEDIEDYADSEYVTSYYYTMSTGVNSDDIEPASSTNDSDSNDNAGDSKMPGGDMGGRGGFGGSFKNETSGDFTFQGYSSYEAMTEFIEGTYKITDGEVSENFEEYNCIINSELATLNDISVGDKIEFIDPEDEDNTYKLTVTGIYEEEDSTNTGMSMFTNSVNTIITNTKVLSDMKEENDDLQVSTTPTFILTNSDVVDAFSEELTDKGLSEYLTVQTNLDQVASATSTISNVKSFAITFLVITLIIGTVVLLVINMINIRERKYEIGVLRTIGMKKSAVSLQFLYELIIVAFVFLLLGAGIGSVLSVPVSNSLLENEISSSQEEMNNVSENFGFNKDNMNGDTGNGRGGKGGNMPGNMEKVNGVAAIQAFDSIDAVVDFKVLLELLGLGMLITIISGISSMVCIQRFSPLTILKERS